MLALICLAPPKTIRADIVVNGSFEEGSFSPNQFGFQSLPPGSTNIFGWTTFNGESAWIGTPNIANWPASDGNRFIDLTGTIDTQPWGGIRQTLTTTIGTVYDVAFDLSVNQSVPDSRGPITVRVEATGNPFQDFTYDPPGIGIQWGNFVYSFTAAAASTDLSFLGILSTGGRALNMDNVHVQAVPEPSSFLSVGFATLGLFGLKSLRRK
jgi:hypothetical protein